MLLHLNSPHAIRDFHIRRPAAERTGEPGVTAILLVALANPVVGLLPGPFRCLNGRQAPLTILIQIRSGFLHGGQFPCAFLFKLLLVGRSIVRERAAETSRSVVSLV